MFALPSLAGLMALRTGLLVADKHTLAVGGLMSSSNAFTGDEVVVESNQPLLWTTQFHD
jgi:hypothetical protein